MHFHSWKLGLKTGQYYFRSRPARDAIKFTVDVESLLTAAEKGTNQVLECLNTKQNKADMKKKRTTAKPGSLSEMKKPVNPSAPATVESKENAQPASKAAAAQQDDDSSDVEFEDVVFHVI